MQAYAQAEVLPRVSVGPVTVDTGDSWFDLSSVVFLLIFGLWLLVLYRRWTR